MTFVAFDCVLHARKGEMQLIAFEIAMIISEQLIILVTVRLSEKGLSSFPIDVNWGMTD